MISTSGCMTGSRMRIGLSSIRQYETHGGAGPLRAEARECLCVPALGEDGGRQQLGGGHHALAAAAVDPDLEHATPTSLALLPECPAAARAAGGIRHSNSGPRPGRRADAVAANGQHWPAAAVPGGRAGDRFYHLRPGISRQAGPGTSARLDVLVLPDRDLCALASSASLSASRTVTSRMPWP